jgi:hypothetical protein
MELTAGMTTSGKRPAGRPPKPNSERDIARRNGVAPSAVHKMIKRGRIDPSQPSQVIDLMMKAQADLQQMMRGLGIEHVPKDYAEAQTALEQLKVHEKALKLQVLAASLVEREEVNRLFFELGKRSREAWEQWPARVASEMAAKLGVKEHLLQTMLTEYVKADLTSLKVAVTLELRGDKAAADGDGAA